MTQTVKKRKERAYADHQPKWQRFQTSLIKPNNGKKQPLLHPYQRQYSHVYHQRLAALKPRCWQNAPTPAGGAATTKVDRVLDLRETQLSMVVGTLVKEGGSGGELICENSRCKSSQSIFMEDESGRCNLEVPNVHAFCTGMVVGIVGTVATNGMFQVEDVFYPALPPHPTIQSNDPVTLGSPHLLLVSGLECGNPSVSSLHRSLILEYCRGHFNYDMGANVAQVIIAGGSTTGHDEHPTTALKELDALCWQLCALGVCVDILPGKEDPTTANWPQRPLHRSLLKFSDRSSLLMRVPNPYAAVHADKFILGTDGTNVTDLAQSLLTENKEPVTHLEALKKTLHCGHICPTGPDTVPTMPHPETDPMVLQETPHLYFAGNCQSFATEIVEENDTKCRLVCVPKFAGTGEVVLVNLVTLEAEKLIFGDPKDLV